MSRALLPVLASLALIACGNGTESPASTGTTTAPGQAQPSDATTTSQSQVQTPAAGQPVAETPATPAAETAPATTTAFAAESTPASSGTPAPAMLAFADADLANGQRQYRRCQSCHTINEGGRNTVGPNLYDTYGHPAARLQGFSYSRALSESGLVWDHDTLDAWIENPSRLVPGTRMSFVGLRDADDRRDVIAYLASMAPAPAEN